MQSTDSNSVLKSQIKTLIMISLVNSPFTPSKQLYNGVARALCDIYGFGTDTISRIAPLDCLKTSMCGWKSEHMPMHGVLDSANFDISESISPNGRNCLLNKELDGEEKPSVCDVEYLRRFTGASHFKIHTDGTFRFSSTSF